MESLVPLPDGKLLVVSREQPNVCYPTSLLLTTTSSARLVKDGADCNVLIDCSQGIHIYHIAIDKRNCIVYLYCGFQLVWFQLPGWKVPKEPVELCSLDLPKNEGSVSCISVDQDTADVVLTFQLGRLALVRQGDFTWLTEYGVKKAVCCDGYIAIQPKNSSVVLLNPDVPDLFGPLGKEIVCHDMQYNATTKVLTFLTTTSLVHYDLQTHEICGIDNLKCFDEYSRLITVTAEHCILMLRHQLVVLEGGALKELELGDALSPMDFVPLPGSRKLLYIKEEGLPPGWQYSDLDEGWNVPISAPTLQQIRF